MRRILGSAVLLASFCAVSVMAQEHHDDAQQGDQHQADQHQGDQHQADQHQSEQNHYVRHDEWKKGSRINKDDWNRGAQVDYRSHHLKAPPRGYEWREVDGNYVLAAVASGVIASVIAASAAH